MHAAFGSFVCLTAEDREDDGSNQQASGAVADCHQDCVAHTIVFAGAEGGHRDDATPSEAQREEDLTGGVEPHLRLQQHLELHTDQ